MMAETTFMLEPNINNEMTVMAAMPESREDVEEDMAVKVPNPKPNKKKKLKKMVEKK